MVSNCIDKSSYRNFVDIKVIKSGLKNQPQSKTMFLVLRTFWGRRELMYLNIIFDVVCFHNIYNVYYNIMYLLYILKSLAYNLV